MKIYTSQVPGFRGKCVQLSPFTGFFKRVEPFKIRGHVLWYRKVGVTFLGKADGDVVHHVPSKIHYFDSEIRAAQRQELRTSVESEGKSS